MGTSAIVCRLMPISAILVAAVRRRSYTRKSSSPIAGRARSSAFVGACGSIGPVPLRFGNSHTLRPASSRASAIRRTAKRDRGTRFDLPFFDRSPGIVQVGAVSFNQIPLLQYRSPRRSAELLRARFLMPALWHASSRPPRHSGLPVTQLSHSRPTALGVPSTSEGEWL